MHRLFSSLALLLAVIGLSACSTPASDPARRGLAALPPADVILLGEQHDDNAHHAIEQRVVSQLAAAQRLAALALEMAEQGRDTRHLPASASDADVQQALGWNDKAWPWVRYGPVTMAAVRAGVPVLGANLPRAAMGSARADASLDGHLPGPALKAQQQAIRLGHCNLLPESQITPMTRIQIARDRAMADTVRSAAREGQVVLLVAGAGHVDRSLGVPRHLPGTLRAQAVRLQAGEAADRSGVFDATWYTPARPAQDHCASLKPAG